MNPSTQPSRTELIQRLADGELSETERTELLQKIDDETPERWRDVALCLLGNRLLAEGLRSGASAPSIAPAQNVIPFPMWKRVGALAAALAVGLGLGFVAPRQREAGNVAGFANLDEFKKAVGEAVEDSELGDGLQSLLAANLRLGPDGLPLDSAGGGGPNPFEPAPSGNPRPTKAAHPEPEPAPVNLGSPSPGPAPFPRKPEGLESKVDQIQKNVADIRRLLQSMQTERK